jgi:hypothetical protein
MNKKLNIQNPIPLQKSTAEKKESWGKRLLIAAWIVVIFSATYGLTIAWSQGYANYLGSASLNEGVFPASQLFGVFLGALPFVIVSVIELLKIPLVYKIYKSKRVILKSIYATALLLVTLITFETLISGFERDYESYVNFMAELKRPIQLGIDVVTIWAVSLAFIVSTSGILLAFGGMALKKNKE